MERLFDNHAHFLHSAASSFTNAHGFAKAKIAAQQLLHDAANNDADGASISAAALLIAAACIVEHWSEDVAHGGDVAEH